MKKILNIILLLCLSISVFTQTTIEKQTPTGYVNISKDPPKPAFIEIIPQSVEFTDADNNNMIDANEICKISFDIKNTGLGEGMNLQLKVEDKNNTGNISFSSSKSLGNLAPGSSQTIEIPISAGMGTTNGKTMFSFYIEELNGFGTDPFVLEVPVKAFVSPMVKIVDYKITSQSGTTIEKKRPFEVQAVVQNLGQGKAENVTVKLPLPANMFCLSGNETTTIDQLLPGDSKLIEYSLVANNNYSLPDISLSFKVSEKYHKYSENKNLSIALNQKVSREKLSIAGIERKKHQIEVVSLTSAVDKNIPNIGKKYPNRIALIIGNEDYSGTLNAEINVDYAVNDAQVVREYALKTLGVEEQNIIFLTNATAGQMRTQIDLAAKLAEKMGSNAEIIFYYAGHGLPDETTKVPYLIPVDVNATNLSAAIKLGDVYNKFGNSGAQKVTVFMDACFTGGGRNQGLLAARGVRIKPKENKISGNMVVFTATTGEQSALPYHKEKHGMFTYFLLKKLQESNGNTNYAELAGYIKQNVSVEALRVNSKEQDPEVNVSYSIQNNWENWKITE